MDVSVGVTVWTFVPSLLLDSAKSIAVDVLKALGSAAEDERERVDRSLQELLPLLLLSYDELLRVVSMLLGSLLLGSLLLVVSLLLGSLLLLSLLYLLLSLLSLLYLLLSLLYLLSLVSLVSLFRADCRLRSNLSSLGG